MGFAGSGNPIHQESVGDRRSRRALLRAGFGAVAALCGTAVAAGAQIKISQAAVGYQEQPSGDRRCAICAHFRQPNQCQLVTGAVSPLGWCRLFAPASVHSSAGPVPAAPS
jgi:hypothetical protein